MNEISIFQTQDQLKSIEEKEQKSVELQVQYDQLLQMYGQKVSFESSTIISTFIIPFFPHSNQAEEYEELKQDLIDLRSISSMQKLQIDDLTQKFNEKNISTS